MYLHGEFLNRLGETVALHIVTNASRTPDIEIGGAGSGVVFAGDPLEITSSVNGCQDHLLRSEASIRLLVRDIIPDLFCASARDAAVNIFKGGKCVFAGYVTPQAYSQPYNEAWDDLEISCIDALSALQFSKYGDVGSAGVDYSTLKSSAAMRSMHTIVTSILGGACGNLALSGTSGYRLWYDGSKSISSTKDYKLLSGISISELLFLGGDEDEVWTQEDVLLEILKYLNLQLVQDGLDLYLFSWETVLGNASIKWHDLIKGTEKTLTRKSLAFANSNAVDTDTQISYGEIYNQIILNCETEGADELVESPLDSASLTSPYTARQLYMREYSAEHDDNDLTEAAKAFRVMVAGNRTEYANASQTDWFIRVKDHPSWKFRYGYGMNLVEALCRDNARQQGLPNWMTSHITAGLVAWGKVKWKADRSDNSLTAKIDMSDTLTISVNGNGNDTESGARPTDRDLLNAAPVAEYTGAASGGVYSPADESAVNYIVISGKIVLNPRARFSATYKAMREDTMGILAITPVDTRDEDYGRYYTQQFFKSDSPANHAVWDPDSIMCLQPFTDEWPQSYEFKYSAVGDSSDKISKVAAVACMLVIGNKCCVEEGVDGRPHDFVWKTFKERSQCANDDEYYAQCFTIGFDPKIGDKLVGTEFDIQNNIDYTLGLDTEGTGIPIRRRDNLSGKVRFMILGPVNTMWDEITRRHRTWFRREKWTSTSIPLLSHVSNIQLKDLSISLVSDNAGLEPLSDSDLVYMSDTDERYVNRKDDITFRIVSALTAGEREELGVRDSLLLSTPADVATGLGLTAIYDHNRGAMVKPEQGYVDSCYAELHAPLMEMEQSVVDTTANVSAFHHYTHPARPGKTYFVEGIGRNLIEASARLKLKEIWK